MSSRIVSKLVVITAGLIALPAVAVAGVATAQPGNGPLIHTSCSYEQLYSAIQAEAPRAGAELDNRPAAQQKLRSIVAMSVAQRQQEWARLLSENPEWQAKIDEKWETPEGQEKVQQLARIAETCHNY